MKKKSLESYFLQIVNPKEGLDFKESEKGWKCNYCEFDCYLRGTIKSHIKDNHANIIAEREKRERNES